MTDTDRPARADLAREAFADWLADRACPLHAAESVVYEDRDLILVGCAVPACPVTPVDGGAF